MTVYVNELINRFLIFLTKQVRAIMSVPPNICEKAKSICEWAAKQDNLDPFFKESLILTLKHLSHMEKLYTDPEITCWVTNDDTVDFTAGCSMTLSEFVLYTVINAKWKIYVDVMNSGTDFEISVEQLRWSFSLDNKYDYEIEHDEVLKDNETIPEDIRDTLLEKICEYLEQKPELSIKNRKKWKKRYNEAVTYANDLLAY